MFRQPAAQFRFGQRPAEMLHNFLDDFRRGKFRNFRDGDGGAAQPPEMRQGKNPGKQRRKARGHRGQAAVLQNQSDRTGGQQIHRLDAAAGEDAVNFQEGDAHLHFGPQQHALVIFQFRKTGLFPAAGERGLTGVGCIKETPRI